MSTRTTLTTVRRRLLGVAFLGVLVLFVTLTLATYNKAFTSTTDVVLRTNSAGNQLLPDSDVKVRGMVVGEVRDIRSNGNGAVLTLALQPDKARELPANVSARLLPKTLFGERYVSLDLPQQPSSKVLRSGDLIDEDRSQTTVELERVLSDLMPVLQAVHPEELATTLNALDQALAGRGKPLGETLSQLNTYLQGINPSMPQLQENLRQLVGFAQTYQQAAPDALQALANLTTTSRTLVQQRQNLDAMTTQLTASSNDLTTFFQQNGKNLIRLNESARPTLDVLAKYAPEDKCFLTRMADWIPRANQIFGAGTNQPGLHITLEVTKDRGKYVPGEEPQNLDKRGPRCYNVNPRPNPFPQYPPDGPIKDGSNPPPAAKTSNSGLNPASSGAQSTAQSAATTMQQAVKSTDLGVVNSPDERDFVDALLAPSLGVNPGQVPDWSSLLVGPLLRGAEVSYR